VGTTLALTVGIIVLVIFVFLGSARATVIPALTIPASVIPAAIVAAALGYSLNVLTILAVILAISLCTDDAVVIMENIRRRQRDGEPLLLAAARATRQVGTAVFASALVLIAVILPLAFLKGNVGLLFREFAVVLAAIVASSTLAALSLSPMLSTLLFRDGAEPGRLERIVGGGLDALGRWYGRLLGWAMGHAAVTLLAGAAFVAVGAMAFGAVEREVAPEEDRGALFVRVEGPEGVSPAYVDRKVAEIERLVADLSGEDGPVESVLAILSPGSPGRADPTVGLVILRLRDWGDREETQGELVERLQAALPGVVGVQAFANSPSGLNQGGRPVEVVLQGSDRDVLAEWSEEVLAGAATLPGVFGLDADYSVRTPQVAVAIDRSRAAALGIDAQTVGETLQIMFGDTPVTRYVDRQEEYDVILQGLPENSRVPGDIENVFVRAASGDLVPLSSVVVPRETSTARTLERLDRQPSITLGAGVSDTSLGEVLDAITGLAEDAQPPGTLIAYTGQSLDFQESGNAVLLILVVIVVVVFLILAGQFESFRDPLVILISAPAAVAGGILILLVTGQTLNIYSQIAMLLLIGLVAKNAILLVEFANQLRDDGEDPRGAMLQAATKRLRPILMTTLATILGAVPLILESGAGAEARLAVGAVIASGTTLGTLLTLFIVPVLYVVLARSSKGRNARETELAEQEREHPEHPGDAAAMPAE
jgi:multidrug efflux pump